MDLHYPYIPKWVQSAKALRKLWRHKDMPDLKIEINCDFLRKIGENLKFCYKSFEISEFHRVFCLYKKEMVIPTCSVSFSIIVCRYFFRLANLCFLKTEKVASTPPPSDFDGLPYPQVRWYPNFFHENDRKGCKRDYLNALGNFL